ncbi:hypothetical protein PsorP6_019176 [Peronosclerospora sorghi]|nr:hypothetical protein PsorP6_019176 [Peronosclerospora sorghi]
MFEENQRLTHKIGDVLSLRAEFAPHMTSAQLNKLLTQPFSQVLAGKLEVSTNNPMEAYVLVEKPHAIEKVFVFGRAAMNRDTQWRDPQSNLLLLHYVKDETYHDQQSKSIEQETDNEELEAIPTGQVVGILRRSTRYHVDTILASTVNAGDDSALAVPMEQRLHKVRLRSQRLDVLVGKRLKIVIDGWDADSTYPNGQYVGILGASGNLQTELSSLLVDNEVE